MRVLRWVVWSLSLILPTVLQGAFGDESDAGPTKEKFCVEKLFDNLVRPVALEIIDDDVLIGEHRGKLPSPRVIIGP